MTKFISLSTSKLPCTGVHEPLKSSLEPKIVRYSPWKRPEMTKITSLSTSKLPCTRGHGPLKSSPEPKTAHENGKNNKIHEFVYFQIAVSLGSQTVKFVPEPKAVRYSPWKRPEMTKFTSFVDFQITVYWGSRTVVIVLGAKKQPMKTAEMTKFMSLSTSKLPCTRDHIPLKSYQSRKQCAIAHENSQKWQNSRVLLTSKLPCIGVHEPL